jgi:two-component system heavy metal sensor histidine kinase CusS
MTSRFGLRRRLMFAFMAAVTGTLLLFSAIVILSFAVEGEEQDPAAAPESDFQTDTVRILWAMAAALPVSALAAGALGVWLARRAVAPMEEASARAEQARTSMLELSLPVTGRDPDWDRLASTLNTLLGEGRRSMHRIQRFTGDAAHELRTPIYSILGESELALRRQRSPEELRAALEGVHEEALRLQQVVDSLLLLARADEGTSVLERHESVHPRALVLAAVERLGKRPLPAGNTRLTVALEGEANELQVDAPLFGQVLDNLLGNAEQYGARSLQVELSSSPDGTVVFQLHDDGPGIPDALIPRLFERFARGADTRAGEGSGLGLSICKTIIEAHGGKLLHVPSPRGASFRIEIPPAKV